LLTATTLSANQGTWELDRSGYLYFQARGAYTFPSGYLSSTNYRAAASSWRTEGFSAGLEVGYYLSNSTVGGIELSYSHFPPKEMGALTGGASDDSRVRVRRFSVFVKYQMVPRGTVRPFIKVGYGYYDLSRFAMPVPGTEPLETREYSISGKPAFSGGLGIVWYISTTFSAELSLEAIYLNSFSAGWSSVESGSGPLKTNLYFFPVFCGISWHIARD
jgi:hypothetical protein